MSRDVLKKKNTIDYTLLIVTVAIAFFGVYMILSATYYSSIFDESNNPLTTFYSSFKKLGVGLACMVFFIFFKVSFLKKISPIIMVGSVVMLILTKLIGPVINGSQRWLMFGSFSFATAEFCKLAAILYFARILENVNSSPERYYNSWINVIVFTAISCALIVTQPDLSTTIIYCVIVVVMLFVSGVKFKHLIFLLVIGSMLIAGAVAMEPYRWERVTTLFSEDTDMGDKKAQGNQAIMSVAEGGVFGVGAGRAYQTKNAMSQAESDFIFATVVETTGVLGAVLLISGYMFMVWRIFRNAMLTDSKYASMVMITTGSMIAFQAMIHMFVNTKTFPVTGVTLPLVSFGGTSVMILLSSIGIVLNLSAHPEDV